MYLDLNVFEGLKINQFLPRVMFILVKQKMQIIQVLKS